MCKKPSSKATYCDCNRMAFGRGQTTEMAKGPAGARRQGEQSTEGLGRGDCSVGSTMVLTCRCPPSSFSSVFVVHVRGQNAAAETSAFSETPIPSRAPASLRGSAGRPGFSLTGHGPGPLTDSAQTAAELGAVGRKTR